MSKLQVIPKTTEGLRDALFDEINALRQGKSNPQHARVLCQLANKVIDSIRVQIQYGRLLNDKEKASAQSNILLGTKP
jgi:hypothetical protein